MNKILIIEDEPEQIKLISMRLKANGYDVISAESAGEGLRIAEEKDPDLILLDILLPDMSGLDVAESLRSRAKTKEVPIIAITAVGTPDIEEQCKEAGISGFIRKPYESQDLIDKIKNLLEV